MLGDSLIQPNHKKCKISVYLRGGLKLLLGTVRSKEVKYDDVDGGGRGGKSVWLVEGGSL